MQHVAGLAAGIVMSALPLWTAARQQMGAHAVWNRTIAGAPSRWAKGLLVVQVALSVVMLAGAGLLIRSLYLLQQVDPGVNREGVLVVRVMPLPGAYRDMDNASYYPALQETLRAIPGVRFAGFGRMFPRLTAEALTQPLAFVGDAAGGAGAVLETVSRGFFETLGVPLLGGRLPDWADDEGSLAVAVVSESPGQGRRTRPRPAGRRGAECSARPHATGDR